MLSKLVSYGSQDVRQLHEAMQRGIADVDKVASILANRSPDERLKIKRMFHDKYKKDLAIVLRNSTIGSFKMLTSMWMVPPDVADAMYVRTSIFESVLETRNFVLVEIACTRTPAELLTVRRTYHNMYKSSIEEDVGIHRTGDIRKILLLLLGAYRYPGEEIHWDEVGHEAELLHIKIRQKLYNDDELIRILTTRNHAHLRKTFYTYSRLSDTNILYDLRYEREDINDDDLRPILRVTIMCLAFPVSYFEKVLDESSGGDGAIDVSTITRVLATKRSDDFDRFREFYV